MTTIIGILIIMTGIGVIAGGHWFDTPGAIMGGLAGALLGVGVFAAILSQGNIQ